MLNIQFDTGNACFYEDIDGTEYFNVDAVEEILQHIVFSMMEGDTSVKIRDMNGNTIGEWENR